MSAETTTTDVTEIKAPKKAAAKKTPAAVKKTPAKKTAPAKGAAKKTAAPKEKKERVERTDVKWTEKRFNVVKAMKALNCVKEDSARSAVDIAAKAGMEAQEIKHYCYKEEQLVKFGYAEVCKQEGTSGLFYYLTVKGAKVDLQKVGKELKDAAKE